MFVLKKCNTQPAGLYIHHYTAMQGQYRLRWTIIFVHISCQMPCTTIKILAMVSCLNSE